MNRNGKHRHSPNERLSCNLVYFLQTKPEFAANIAEAVLIFLPAAIEGSNVRSATSLDDDVFIHSAEYGKMGHQRFQEYALANISHWKTIVLHTISYRYNHSHVIASYCGNESGVEISLACAEFQP